MSSGLPLFYGSHLSGNLHSSSTLLAANVPAARHRPDDSQSLVVGPFFAQAAGSKLATKEPPTPPRQTLVGPLNWLHEEAPILCEQLSLIETPANYRVRVWGQNPIEKDARRSTKEARKAGGKVGPIWGRPESSLGVLVAKGRAKRASGEQKVRSGNSGWQTLRLHAQLQFASRD